jgi:alpha-tubulin suppressor-like RCC1 family protein
VSSNYDYSAAVKTDGTLWTWGFNNKGQLGTNNTTNYSSPVTVAGGGTTWRQVCTAHQGSHLAAVKTDGTLWTCGYNNSGQLGDGTTTNRSSFVQIAGGGTTWQSVGIGGRGLAAIKTDGTLWTCGYNGYGNLGYNGGDRSSPGTVAGGGTTWSQVAVGLYHAVAVKTDGTLWSCGYNINGQLGDGTTTTRNTGFVQVAGTLWKQAAVATWSSAAVKTDGTVWAWGYGGAGQLGNGTTTNSSSPTTVGGTNTNWQQVAVGANAMAAIG